MQTDLTSGAPQERTRPLDVWGRPRGKRTRRNRLDLRGSQPPVTPAQACLAVGRPLRGHGTPWAAGGQKHRGPAWLALGYGVVCAVGGVHAGEGDQRLDPACGHRLWLCRSEPALVRYHRAGVAHWVSQRTGDVAWWGTALWPSPAEAHNPCGAGGRHGAGSGRDDPQIGQRTPPLCQGQAREASGVDPSPHRGGPVGRGHQAHGRTAEAEPRSCHTKCQSDAWGDARGGQAAHPTDRAVDHHRGGGPGHNRPCWLAPGTCHRAQQGRQDGGVWPAVSPESPRWWVYLWDRDPRRGGRVEKALAGAGGVPRDLWCARHPYVDGLRPGWLCYGDPAGARPRGSQGDRHPAQRPRGVARCRGRPRDGPERARQDRRDHWHSEDGQIWVQQAQGTSVADAGDGRSPVYPLLQSEQVDAGPGPGRQMRIRGIGTGRTTKTAPRERQGGRPRGTPLPSKEFCDTLYVAPKLPDSLEEFPLFRALLDGFQVHLQIVDLLECFVDVAMP